jgi:hypothetical protein
MGTVSTSSPKTILTAQGSVSQTPRLASSAGVMVSALFTQKVSATATMPSAP